LGYSADMPRMARVVIPGEPHHVTQRGNRREKVFRRRADYVRYLALLSQYACKHGLAVKAYCLMSNHVHLIVVPRDAAALAATLKPVHLRYAQELNRRMGVGGVLWQGRFHSCPLDGDHYWTAVRYVERNPVRAGLVRRAEEYAWSSAAAHCGLRGDELLSQMAPPEWLVNLPAEEVHRRWSLWLRDEEDEQATRRLRMCTRTGRPVGARDFVDRLERLLGRTLRPKKGGRPRKRKKHG
jgi:putative transposase